MYGDRSPHFSVGKSYARMGYPQNTGVAIRARTVGNCLYEEAGIANHTARMGAYWSV
jgi:hypothetical protein